jgi:predicted DNA-binding protein with PD1-like motif
MQFRELRSAPERSFLLRLERGEQVVATLTAFCDEQDVNVARFEGIGALQDAELGFYHLDRKDYDRFTVSETEALALLGNVSRLDGEPRIHAHLTVGEVDGTARGGHLFEARVGATLEIFLDERPGEVVREMDEAIGLPLLQV